MNIIGIVGVAIGTTIGAFWSNRISQEDSRIGLDQDGNKLIAAILLPGLGIGFLGELVGMLFSLSTII